MGIRHLTTFLRTYANIQSLAGQQIVIDGPALAHHIYFVCLRGTRGSQNAIEAAPSYAVLGRTTLQWLRRLEKADGVIKKIYFDGFLPSMKYDTRIERIVRQTRQLKRFHQETPLPCRASYPRFENELDDPFDCSVYSSHTALPYLPFLVPAIIEALVASAKYGPVTEVVPGEADLWCAEHSRQHGGLILTGDSDLLVYDLGPDGAVSFLKDIQPAADESMYALQTYSYQPSTIVKRLQLPETYGLRSLAFELVKDPHITHLQLRRQAQSLKAIAMYPEDFAEFLKEYVQLLPSISDKLKDSIELKTILRRLDPRISEYVLQSPIFALRDNTPLPEESGSGDPHIFLPFLLDCPVNISAWENSMNVRQLAYSLINMVSSDTEKVRSVFEHRKQIDESRGRKLQLSDAVSIPDACNALLLSLLEMKKKLPGLDPSLMWTAWSIDQDKSSLASVFMQQFLQVESSEESGSFTWDIVRFFAELQASFYSFRILKQILDVVVTISRLHNLPSSVQSLYAQLQNLPDVSQFPSLADASCAVRKIGDQEQMLAIKHIVKTLLPTSLETETGVSAMDAEEPAKGTKKKRKRLSKLVKQFAINKKSTNMFELLSTE